MLAEKTDALSEDEVVHARSRSIRLLCAVAIAVIVPGLPSVAAAATAFDGIARSAALSATQRVKVTEKSLRKGQLTYYTKGRSWLTCRPTGWAAGYFPGQLWASYALTSNRWYATRAASRQKPIGKSPITAESTDIGIRSFYSYARGYDLTGKPAYRAAALKAARGEAARFNPVARVVRSRNTPWTCQVVIDEMMNLQILYWGSEHGGSPAWADIAHQHALTAAAEFVRFDGSVYHIVNFDPQTGEVRGVDRGQGYSTDSMWARGQAWALHGFATAYRHTGDTTMLDTARRVADRYLAELPADSVPYWDFRAPGIPGAPRDSSAAAVAASGLLDLASLETSATNRERYASAAKAALTTLSSSRYFSAKKGPAILLHGVQNYWNPATVDKGQSYGDYFFLEALTRLRALPAGEGLPPYRMRASRGNPYLAVDGTATTAWTSSGSQWLEFDLGRKRPVSAVTLGVRWGDTRSAGFKVRVSSDRRHWRQVAAFRSDGGSKDPETYAFKPSWARYVRVSCSGTTSGKANAITEAAVH